MRAFKAFEVPVTGQYKPDTDLASHQILSLLNTSHDPDEKATVENRLARFIVYSLGPACLEHNDDNVLGLLQHFLKSVRPNLHPSNSSRATKTLAKFLSTLSSAFTLRWNLEQSGELKVEPERRLNDDIKKALIRILRDSAFVSIYDGSALIRSYSADCLMDLAYLEPDLVVPGALKRIYPSMRGLVETRRTIAAMEMLKRLVRILVSNNQYRPHVVPLMELCLPGIDANDIDKTHSSLEFIQTVFQLIPFHQVNGDIEVDLAMDWVQNQMEIFETMVSEEQEPQNYTSYPNGDSMDIGDGQLVQVVASSTAAFPTFLHACLEKLFSFIENSSETMTGTSSMLFRGVFIYLFASASEPLAETAVNLCVKFIQDASWSALESVEIIANTLMLQKDRFVPKIFPQILSVLKSEILDNHAGCDRKSTERDVLPRDRALVWNLRILKAISPMLGASLMEYKEQLVECTNLMRSKLRGYAAELHNDAIGAMLESLVEIYSADRRTIQDKPSSREEMISLWGASGDLDRLQVIWHVPTDSEISFACQIYNDGISQCIGSLQQVLQTLERNNYKLDRAISADLLAPIYHVSDLTDGISRLFDTMGDSTKEPFELRDSVEPAERYAYQESNSFPLVSGYFFQQNRSDPRLSTLMKTKELAGESLVHVHELLTSKCPDETQCLEATVASLHCWLASPSRKVVNPLDDAEWYENDVEHFQRPGLRKNYPRSTLALRAFTYHCKRLGHSRVPTVPSGLERRAIEALFQSNNSIYSSVRSEAQFALSSCSRLFIGLSVYICLKALPNLESDEKHILTGALHLVDEVSSSFKVMGRLWQLRRPYFLGILKAQRHDGSSLKPYAYSVFAKITTRQLLRRKSDYYPANYLGLIELFDKHPGRIKDTVDFLSHAASMNESDGAEFVEEQMQKLPEEHWRVVVIILSFSATTVSLADAVPNRRFIEALAIRSVDEQAATRSLSIAMLASLLPLLRVRSLVSDIGKVGFKETLERGQKKITIDLDATPSKLQLKKSFMNANKTYLMDSYNVGWLVWPREYAVFIANHDEKVEVNDGPLEEVFRNLGGIFTEGWFDQLLRYMTEEPRGAETGSGTKMRFQVVNFLSCIWSLNYWNEECVGLQYAVTKVAELCTETSEKYHHRAAIEVLCSFVAAWEYGTRSERDHLYSSVMPVISKALENKLNPDNIAYWKSFVRYVFTQSDPVKHLPLLSVFKDVSMELNSDHAFSESTKLSLHRKLISACNWHYSMEPAKIETLLQYLGHPYKKVRSEIGYNLDEMLRSNLIPPFDTAGQLIDQSYEAKDGCDARYLPFEDLQTYINRMLDTVRDRRMRRDENKDAYHFYASTCKTVLSFLQQATSGYDGSNVYRTAIDRLSEEVVSMLDLNDDPELRVQAAGQLFRMANSDLALETLENFVAGVERIANDEGHWHHRLHIVPALIRIIWGHLAYFNGELRGQVFDMLYKLLSDSKVEVRNAAADGITAMLFCVSHDDDKIILRLIREFESTIDRNPPPLRSELSSGTSSPGNPTQKAASEQMIRRHSAVLGLTSILASCPYDRPPEWMPSVVGILLRCSNDPHPIGKSVKQELEKFRKLRSDTWHLDQMSFSREQLEDLTGLSSHNYFV